MLKHDSFKNLYLDVKDNLDICFEIVPNVPNEELTGTFSVEIDNKIVPCIVRENQVIFTTPVLNVGKYVYKLTYEENKTKIVLRRGGYIVS